MPGGVYDSPTFLSQKDKYLLGLTLPQLMACMVIALFAFLISLSLPSGFALRLAFVVPATFLGSFLAFGRVYGLSIPAFLFTALTFPLRSPVYEAFQTSLLRGDLVWLARRAAAAAAREPKGVKGLRSRAGQLSAAAGSYEAQSYKAELKSETGAKVDEGARSLERFVRDGIRSVFKGA